MDIKIKKEKSTSVHIIVLEDNECIFHKKVRVKYRGEIWVINRYDLDPFPSNPHAHEIQSGFKLDLSNGALYISNRFNRRIGKKKLRAIRELFQQKEPSLVLPLLTV